MIPISFLLALPAFSLALFLALRREPSPRIDWPVLFLLILFIQLALVGLRFGYGFDPKANLHGYTNILLPPLAYLSFARKGTVSWADLSHLIPVLLACLLVKVLVPDAIDVLLGCVGLFYLLALLRISRKAAWLFDWASTRWTAYLVVALWGTIAMQVLAMVTDFAIAFDFLIAKGQRTREIVAVACIVGVVIYLVAYFIWLKRGDKGRPASPSAQDEGLVTRLLEELGNAALLDDPELTLGDVARHMKLSSRQISEAINRAKKQSFPQFINSLRIEAACKALEDSDKSVTIIMLESGYYTKSNFNKEFKRHTGTTPTEWRRHRQSRRSDH